MGDREYFSKSKSFIKGKQGDYVSNKKKKHELKSQQQSFSQATQISDDTKENQNLIYPVSSNDNINLLLN